MSKKIEQQLERLSKLGLVEVSNNMSGEWYCTFDENKVLGDPRFRTFAFADSLSGAVAEIYRNVTNHYEFNASSSLNS